MSAGTLKLTNNSNAVVGTSTTFTTDLKSGDVISTTIGGIPYTLFVDTVTSNTAATLTDVFTGPTTTGVAYVAVPQQTLNRITAALAAQTAEAVRRMLQENANWQAFYSGTGDITVTLPDGTPTGRQVPGPSWAKINQVGGSAWQDRGQLSASANLNTMNPATTEGEWSKGSSTGLTVANGFPVGAYPGLLKVMNGGYYAGTQIYTSALMGGNGRADCWVRYLTANWNGTDGPWSDWVNIATSGLRSTLITNTDLNNLNTVDNLGSYRMTAANGTLAFNYPYEGFAGSIEVVQGYGSGVQQIAVANTGNMFSRYMNSATTWTAWYEVGYTSRSYFSSGDLNTLTDAGLYNISYAAATSANLPVNTTGIMRVYQRGNSNAQLLQEFFTVASTAATANRKFSRTLLSGVWSAWDEDISFSQLGAQFGIGAANPVTTAVNWQTYNWVNGASLQIDAPTMTNAPAPVDSYTSGSLGINVLGVAGDPSATTGNAWGLLLVSAYVNGVGSTRRLFHVIFRGPNGARNYTVAEVFQLNNTLGISNGGTGATTAADSRAALGVSYGTIAGTVAQGNDSRLSTVDGKTGGTMTSGINLRGSSQPPLLLLVLKPPLQHLILAGVLVSTRRCTSHFTAWLFRAQVPRR